MTPNITYSPSRLQKAIGNIAGTHLGFPPSAEGGVKPLPQTTAEIVEIKHIYPTKKCVDFYFPGSDTLQTAHALLDYWDREGTDKFQPPKNLNLPLIPLEPSWPFTTPENNSPDLMTIIQLILLSGAPTAPAFPPIIQTLIQKMGNQQNTVKLLQNLTQSGSLDLTTLIQIAGLNETKIKELLDNTKITNTPLLPKIEDITQNPTHPGVKPPNTNIPHIETPSVPNTSEIPKPNTPKIPNGEISQIPPVPKVEIPTEPLYGAVIPLKGDKTQGYLLLGFIKI